MERQKTAIITGASGQDSLMLSNYLIKDLNYKVYAVTRRAARPESMHVNKLLESYPNNYYLVNGDITDISSITRLLQEIKPDEFYNLAAMSHVGLSFKEPLSTYQITGLGAINCMEAVKAISPETRFYQASSSEMFGGTRATEDNKFVTAKDIHDKKLILINENTSLCPMSPYGVAKTMAHNHARIYREAYGLHISCGILFNHESIYRKTNFVTRKVTNFVAEKFIYPNRNKTLQLGCLNFARDWGDAEDYVKGMHLMLQQEKPDDYILATKEVHTGMDLLKLAFGIIGIEEYELKYYVDIHPDEARPLDVKVLIGDYSKAEKQIGWKPTTTFAELIKKMVSYDIQQIERFGRIYE